MPASSPSPTGGGRVALVHDYLSQFGGAERVVLELARMFPEAPIYTAFYHPDGTFSEFRERRVVPSSLQGVIRPERFRAYAPLYPWAFRRFDLSDYDLVVASSSAFAHRVRHPNCHVYCHTPPRFLYQAAAYDRVARAGGGRRHALRLASAPLRTTDRRSARAKASYAANSRLTQRRIRETYGLPSTVVHPPLAGTHRAAALQPLPGRPRLLMVSRLLPYKHVDVAVAVANATGLPLAVAGEGPERERLAAMAGPTVELLGRVPDGELADLFASASLVLAPGAEDFGYGPVEAHWHGRPVVAVAAGGALETVADGTDGLLVDGTGTEQWVRAVTAALDRPWRPEDLRKAADPFTAGTFRRRVAQWLGLPPPSAEE